MVSVHDAMRICQAVCGKLFLPLSIEENQEAAQFVSDNGVSDYIGGNFVWLRATDRYQEGVWQDIETFEDVTFTHWGTDEPNDYGNDEDYVIMDGYGLWNDFFKYSDNIAYGGATRVMALCELPSEIPFWNQD